MEKTHTRINSDDLGNRLGVIFLHSLHVLLPLLGRLLLSCITGALLGCQIGVDI